MVVEMKGALKVTTGSAEGKRKGFGREAVEESRKIGQGVEGKQLSSVETKRQTRKTTNCL